jgi:iron uptake system EfeUOB component EfeO/EfeM
VADSFGALDPKIDAREDDVAADEFEGFHRIEKALWEEGTTAGVASVAKQLQADVEALAAKVKGVELQPYRTEGGFVSYTELTQADTKKLALAIDTLAEELSRVPAAFAEKQ